MGAMKEKLAALIGAEFSKSLQDIGTFNYRQLTPELMADAIIAALPDMVKPLEWRGDRGRSQIWAASSLGEIRITLFGGKWFHKGVCFDGDIEAAKAAAQIDYARRILSAFGIEKDGA